MTGSPTSVRVAVLITQMRRCRALRRRVSPSSRPAIRAPSEPRSSGRSVRSASDGPATPVEWLEPQLADGPTRVASPTRADRLRRAARSAATASRRAAFDGTGVRGAIRGERRAVRARRRLRRRPRHFGPPRGPDPEFGVRCPCSPRRCRTSAARAVGVTPATPVRTRFRLLGSPDRALTASRGPLAGGEAPRRRAPGDGERTMRAGGKPGEAAGPRPATRRSLVRRQLPARRPPLGSHQRS